MSKAEQEKRIISEWVAIQRSLGVEIQDPEWRDKPHNGDIEAIAFPFAVEHTSVDSIEKQRLYEAHFDTVVKDLRQIKIAPPARIKLSINLEDFIRIDHKKLKAVLILWLKSRAPKLPDGHSRGSQIIDIPVEWRCWKYSNRPPGLYFGLAVDTEKGRNEIVHLLSRKDQKLETYRRQGLTSVVIVESDDFQLMAPDIFLEMAMKAHGNQKLSIDQLWFADTSMEDIEFWEIDLKAKKVNGPHSLI
jgi:hypothetical protein